MRIGVQSTYAMSVQFVRLAFLGDKTQVRAAQLFLMKALQYYLLLFIQAAVFSKVAFR